MPKWKKYYIYEFIGIINGDKSFLKLCCSWIDKSLLSLYSVDIGLLFLRKELQILFEGTKLAYFYVKIGLWILTTNFTKIANRKH